MELNKFFFFLTFELQCTASCWLCTVDQQPHCSSTAKKSGFSSTDAVHFYLFWSVNLAFLAVHCSSTAKKFGFCFTDVAHFYFIWLVNLAFLAVHCSPKQKNLAFALLMQLTFILFG